MKKTSILAFALLASLPIFAQQYMTAGGLRIGTDWGLTIQQRIAKNTTVEGIFQSSLQREEVMVTGLIEQHYPLIIRNLNLYFGAGLHKGFVTADLVAADEAYDDPFGISFVGGAELTIGRLNFSYDFKPVFNISGGEKTFYSQTGVSVRYVFLNNKVYKDLTKDKRKRERQEKMDKWKFWKKKN